MNTMVRLTLVKMLDKANHMDERLFNMDKAEQPN